MTNLKYTGENRASEVLSGKRNLTVKMLIALHKHLNIPTDTLLGVGRGQANAFFVILTESVQSTDGWNSGLTLVDWTDPPLADDKKNTLAKTAPRKC